VAQVLVPVHLPSWRPGARAGGAGGAAAQPPVVLSRNGKEYTQTASNVRAGTEIKLTTERPNVSLTLTEMDAGSWVIFELPGFTTAASGTQQSSLDALRKASDTSYFKDKDALGSRWSPTVTVLAAPLAAALVAEPASRSAGKLNPAV
jgi:cell migration-inducing and hyaluronan-binding protein